MKQVTYSVQYQSIEVSDEWIIYATGQKKAARAALDELRRYSRMKPIVWRVVKIVRSQKVMDW